MKVNDVVRITDDEYEELIGLIVHIVEISTDGTTVWVLKEGAKFGVWCSVSALEPVNCPMHTDQTLVWEEGGDDQITVHGRMYCPKCSESLMRALDRDARAVSGEEPYEVLYSVDNLEGEDDIKFTAHYNLDMLEAAYAERDRRLIAEVRESIKPPDPVIPDVSSSFIFEILNEHVGSAGQFCVACPDIRPERDANGDLPDDRWWIKKHQAAKIAERVDERICDALAAGDSMYDAQTMKEHLEDLITRMREEKPPPTTTHDA